MDSYNQALLPQLDAVMNAHLTEIDDALDEFNRLQWMEVTQYNQNKCELQQKIASYGDTLYCFEKYLSPMDVFAEKLDITSCDGCFTHVSAMCLNANGLIAKEYVNHNATDKADPFVHNPFKSGMAERRRYCQEDTIQYEKKNESTVIITAKEAFETSNTLSCPQNMIINKIKMKGISVANDKNKWNGARNNTKYVASTIKSSYNSARKMCLDMNSDLVSIHSDAD
eukprot:14088_1